MKIATFGKFLSKVKNLYKSAKIYQDTIIDQINTVASMMRTSNRAN
jgi:hypothetical protein